MKKFLLKGMILVVAIMILGCCNSLVFAESSGTIGENITWSLTDDGTFTLTGTGEMVLEKDPYLIKPIIPWSGEIANIKKVIIGDGITNIDIYAFEKGTAITEVIIPDSVTVIGSNAFSGCESLATIKIGKNVETIESFAFCGCKGLSEIRWGEKLRTIEDYAFSGCESLVSVAVPSTVVDFADRVFERATKLANITIPDSVKEVREYALYDTAYYNNESNWENGVLYVGKHLVCSNPYDSEGVVTVKAGTLTIAKSAFASSRKVTEIVIPDSVRYIGTEAFSGGRMLQKCLIPDSVTEMGEGVFQGCEVLTEFKLSSAVKEIPASTFKGSGITAYAVPATIKSIGISAFEDCTALESIIFLEGVTYIGDRAFRGCSALTEVTIPNSVVEVGGNLFAECTSLTKVIFGDGLKTVGYDLFYNSNAIDTIVIGDGADFYTVRSILDNLTTIKHLTLGDGVTDFSDALSYMENKNLLETLVLGDGITVIEATEFREYTALKSITLGNNITEIGSEAFDQTAFYKDATNWENDILYIGNYLIKVKESATIESLIIKDGTTCIASYGVAFLQKLKDITIPQSVKHIGDGVFFGCSNLKDMELPDSIISIGYQAFEATGDYKDSSKWEGNLLYINNCLVGSKAGITEVTIKDGTCCMVERCFVPTKNTLKKVVLPSSLTRISEEAFQNCTLLSEINLENVKYIEEYAFYKTGLTSVELPAGMVEIGSNAFYYCNSLHTVIVNNGSIGDSCFNRCPELQFVTLEEGVTSIGTFAFYNSPKLTKVKIPKSVTYIASSAFSNCTALEKIIVEAEVETLGEFFTSNCSKLTMITIPKSVKVLDDFCRYDSTPLRDIYYEGSKEEWEQIEGYDRLSKLITVHYGEELPPEIWVKKIVKEEGKPISIQLDLDAVSVDGQMIGVMMDGDLFGGDADASAEETVTLNFDETAKGNEVKILWWESLESMKPVKEPMVLTLP